MVEMEVDQVDCLHDRKNSQEMNASEEIEEHRARSRKQSKDLKWKTGNEIENESFAILVLSFLLLLLGLVRESVTKIWVEVMVPEVDIKDPKHVDEEVNGQERSIGAERSSMKKGQMERDGQGIIEETEETKHIP